MISSKLNKENIHKEVYHLLSDITQLNFRLHDSLNVCYESCMSFPCFSNVSYNYFYSVFVDLLTDRFYTFQYGINEYRVKYESYSLIESLMNQCNRKKEK